MPHIAQRALHQAHRVTTGNRTDLCRAVLVRKALNQVRGAAPRVHLCRGRFRAVIVTRVIILVVMLFSISIPAVRVAWGAERGALTLAEFIAEVLAIALLELGLGLRECPGGFVEQVVVDCIPVGDELLCFDNDLPLTLVVLGKHVDTEAIGKLRGAPPRPASGSPPCLNVPRWVRVPGCPGPRQRSTPRRRAPCPVDQETIHDYNMTPSSSIMLLSNAKSSSRNLTPSPEPLATEARISTAPMP